MRSYEELIANDLFERIKDESTFLAGIGKKLSIPPFELSEAEKTTLEGIRERYKPEMSKLLELQNFEAYNKVADLLILPPIIGSSR